jgi:NADH-quinone oxidoreductase subunit H
VFICSGGEDVDSNYSVFLIFISTISSVYFIVMAGWASNSKYALLGALRCAAQMISYDIYFGLVLLPIFIYSESLNLPDVMKAQENV